MGPNVSKLLVYFISIEAIPDGGGIQDGIGFFTNPQRRAIVLAKAETKMRAALDLVKTAPDNVYGDDDEAIAIELLRRLQDR